MSEDAILLGDEAVARGAIDAGITAAYAYPGTPSTEIFQTIRDQSQALGLPSYDSGHGAFLDVGGMRSHEYSEETARQVDAEVRQLLAELYDKARQLVRDHREPLLQAVEELLKSEVMEGGRFRDIVVPGRAGTPSAAGSPTSA